MSATEAIACSATIDLGNYWMSTTLGVGATSKVKLAVDTKTGQKVAIKIVDKYAVKERGFNLAKLRREPEILTTLMHHQNIIKMLGWAETENKIYLVMEHCEGGDLYTVVERAGYLLEARARIIFRQMLSAIGYCHSQNIIHRDLKLENFLFDKQGNLKLIDFGLSKIVGSTSPVTVPMTSTVCGTFEYMAPEVIQGKLCDTPADVWGLGVLLYTMVVGKFPFGGAEVSDIISVVLAGNFYIPCWLSKECIDLLKGMLAVDPAARLTVEEVRAHPWVNKGFQEPVNFAPKYPKIVTPAPCPEERRRSVKLPIPSTSAPSSSLNTMPTTNKRSSKRLSVEPSTVCDYLAAFASQLPPEAGEKIPCPPEKKMRLFSKLKHTLLKKKEKKATKT